MNEMVEILAMATVIAPVTGGLLQVVKKATQVNKRYVPLMAVALGIVLGAAAVFLETDIVLRVWAGGISGLAATGLFELGKNAKKDEE